MSGHERLQKYGAYSTEGFDLACYLLRELQAMALIAYRLGLKADEAQYRDRAVRFQRRIKAVFWDDADAFYDDRDAKTGIGVGLNPFWGWSSLAYLLPLEQSLMYDPTDLSHPHIRPIIPEALGLSWDAKSITRGVAKETPWRTFSFQRLSDPDSVRKRNLNVRFFPFREQNLLTSCTGCSPPPKTPV